MKKILILLLLVPLLVNGRSISIALSADTVCQDSCVTFINNTVGAIDSIRWAINGVPFLNPHNDTISVCFPSPGVYIVTLFVYDSARIDSTSNVITIKQMPHPKLIDTSVCGLMVADIYQRYRWYSTPFYFTGDTNYYILETATIAGTFVIVDSNGCPGISSHIERCGDGIFSLQTKNQFTNIFPNPVSSTLTITSPKPISQLTITNLLGQIVFSRNSQNEEVHIDVSELPKGMYFINIDGLEVRRFVKY